MRLYVEDRAGVLSKITSIFSKHGISVAQVNQEEAGNGLVPLIIITHTTLENNVKKAVNDINALSGGSKVLSVIRVVS